MVHFMPKSSGNQEIVIKSSWNIYKYIIQRTHLLFCSALKLEGRKFLFSESGQTTSMYVYCILVCNYFMFLFWPLMIWEYAYSFVWKKEILCGLKSQLNCESLDLFYAELEVHFSKNYWSLQKLQNVIISEHIGSRY